MTDYVDGSPSDNTTLSAVLEQFEDDGFRGAFDVADDGAALRCRTCGETSAVEDIERRTRRRLEGASDPADMVVVEALTCPKCGALGTIVLPFGPIASAAEATVLTGLTAPADQVAPRSTAPGENVRRRHDD